MVAIVFQVVVVFLSGSGEARAPKPQTPTGFHWVFFGMTFHRSPGLLGNLYEESLLRFRVRSGRFQAHLYATAQVGDRR